MLIILFPKAWIIKLMTLFFLFLVHHSLRSVPSERERERERGGKRRAYVIDDHRQRRFNTWNIQVKR